MICSHLSPVADLNGLDTDSHLLERHYNDTLIGSKDLYGERYVLCGHSVQHLCPVRYEPVHHAKVF